MKNWKSQSVYSVLIILLGSGTVLADAGNPAMLAVNPSSNQVSQSQQGYVANNQNLRDFFVALSDKLQKPIIVSTRAAKKAVTGEFDLTNPQALLERVAQQLSLVWYYDGQSVYVYDSSEVKSAVLALHHISLAAFTRFLKKSGLYDRRFAVRGDPMGGVFYLSGPPMYVDLVSNLATFMDKDSKEANSQREKIGVIKLHNTFVSDRTFPMRDQTIRIPGMASVIESLLQPANNKLDPVIKQSDGKAVTQPTSLQELRAELEKLKPPNNDDSSSPSLSAPLASSGSWPRDITQTIAVKVVAFPETNSLLIKGSLEQVNFVENLVAALDVAKRHIELSLWIIDLQKNDLDKLGVSWEASFGNNKRGVRFNMGDKAPMSTLDGANFLAQIQALSNRGQAQVVSRPVVLTQENVPAVFDKSRTIYTKVVGERTAQLDHYTYGTMVDVLPHFTNDGNEIEMKLNIEDGSQSNNPGADTDQLPEVTRTRIDTIARVPRGKSLLIGGYTIDQYQNNVSKIPLLGDLPIIGGLFRLTTHNTSNLVRVFLIEPRVIDTPLDPAASQLGADLVGNVSLPLPQRINQVRSYMNRNNENQ